MELQGLERLMGVCQRLDLGLLTRPPQADPPKAGALVGGLPFDPVLAAVYVRFSKASFATGVAGIVLTGNDESEYGLEAGNASWRKDWQDSFSLPLFLFGGEPGLAYHYMTVPSLGDSRGLQPVVSVDTYEVPYALPIASNVDRFFEVYALYLEALVSHPGYEPGNSAALVFPWDVPHLFARDARLVELIRTGAFDSLMTRNDDAQAWATNVARMEPGHGE